jgi:hypothetical protein
MYGHKFFVVFQPWGNWLPATPIMVKILNGETGDFSTFYAESMDAAVLAIESLLGDSWTCSDQVHRKRNR